jgi:hypothetical protein
MKQMGFCAVLLLFAASAGQAQVASSNLRGRVADESGAPVAGVLVTVTDLKTGYARAATTGSDGTYRLGSLPPSDYRITASLQGYGEARAEVATQVGRTASVALVLRRQAVEAEITVTAESPLVEPTEHDLGTVIEEDQLQGLPLAGRRWQDLAILVPGVAPVDGIFDPTKERVGAVSIGGNLGREINVSIDGGDNNDDAVGGLLMQVSADAIQEFEVVTQAYKAEFGKSHSGLLNVVIRSGTNELSGSAFGFLRDERLRALTPAERREKREDPEFHEPEFDIHQFGATLGGPIVRDRAHYFASYERFEQTSVFEVSVQALDAFGFPDGPACISSGGRFCITEPFVPQTFEQDLLLAKFNLHISEQQHLSLRAAFEFNQDSSGFALDASSAPTNAALQTNDHVSLLLSHTWTFGSNALNELKLQYSDFENHITPLDPTLPTVRFRNATFGANPNTPQTTLQTKIQLRDDFTYYLNRHTLKAGIEWIAEPDLGGNFAFLSSGVFEYDSDTAPLDEATHFYIYSGNADLDSSNHQIVVYVQDDWQVHPDVTLSLGVRYDIEPGMLDLGENQYTRDLDRAFDEGGRRFGKSRVEDDTNNVAPRLGFAWDVNGRGTTVVRGSYGHFFDQTFENLTLFNQFESNLGCSEYLDLGPRSCGPYRRVDIDHPDFGPDNIPDQPSRYPGADTQSGIIPVSPELKNPFLRQLTLGASHQFNRNLALDADLVLSNGYNQFRLGVVHDRNDQILYDDDIFINIDIDGDGQVDTVGRKGVQESDGRTWYRALQTALRGRWQRFWFLAAYTLSSAEGTQVDFLNRSVFGDHYIDQVFDKGPLPQDARHRAVLSAAWEAPWGVNVSTIAQFVSGPPVDVTFGFVGHVLDPTQSCRVPGNCIPDFEHGEVIAGPDNNGDGVPDGFDVNGDDRIREFDRVGRGQLRGDGRSKLDLRLSKVFRLGEKISVELIAEAFNLLNTASRGGGYVGDVRSASFGQPTGDKSASPREIQLGARVRF